MDETSAVRNGIGTIGTMVLYRKVHSHTTAQGSVQFCPKPKTNNDCTLKDWRR